MQEYKIANFLKRVKNQINIEDSNLYKRITIRTNHQGVKLRNETLGIEIGTKKQFIVNGGDFILSKIDARYGAFGIIPDELDKAIITGNFWTYEVDTELVDTEWFFYFTHSYDFLQICKESSTGTTHRKYLNEKIFLNHTINLPEKNIQVEMVKVYKKGVKSVGILKKKVQSQRTLVFQLTQSFLQEAIQGKLTHQWRKKNPELITGKNSAAALLENIKAEKARLIKEKKIKKENQLPPINEEEIPFELPKGWIWCRMGEISTFSDAGKSLTCSDRRVEGEEWGILKVSATSGEFFKQEENKFFAAYLDHTPIYSVEKGDLILSRANTQELVGNSVIVEDLEYNLLLSDKTVRFHYPDQINKQYINIANKGSFLRKYFIDNCTGSSPTMKNISRMTIKNGLIPLPPEEEQKMIVTKVNALLEKCNSLKQEIIQSEQHAKMLKQAVLKEAFEEEKKVNQVLI